MPLFRRRATDPDAAAAREAFRATAALVDTAQRVLLKAVPTSRDPGVPLGDAIEDFLALLSRARSAHPGWRLPTHEARWRACSAAIDEAEVRARALAQDGPLGFEALNIRLGEIVSPLDAFADAAPDI